MLVRGISGQGRRELARVLAETRRTVTPADVSATLGVDADAAAKKLARWTSDGWLRRARRGLYIPVPVDVENPAAWSEDPWILADAVWSPCYFTGWTAANHWGLTEQVFHTIVLRTTRRVRRSAERVLDHDYLLSHTADADLEWGTSAVWRDERRLHVADPSRTVVDAMDDPGLVGGIRHAAEIVEAYVADHPVATLMEYGDRLGNRTVFKRLGFIAERVLVDADELAAQCAARVSSGISQLDPTGPGGGERNAAWGLRINVAVEPREPS